MSTSETSERHPIWIVATALLGLMAVTLAALSKPLYIVYVGTMVKLRTEFRPLRESRTARSRSSSALGFWGILGRSKRLEGWPGLFRGLGPFMFNAITFAVFGGALGMILGALFKLLPRQLERLDTFLFSDSTVNTLSTKAFEVILGTPLSIVQYRVTVHPAVLPWNPFTTLREVLTPEERYAPWRLLRWDLMVIQLALLVENRYIGVFVRQWAAPWLTKGPVSLEEAQSIARPPAAFDLTKMLCLATWTLFSIALLEPLECVYTRLAAQRPYSTREARRASSEASPMSIVGTHHEPVISLRPVNDGTDQSHAAKDAQPSPTRSLERYRGPVDCFQKLAKEEGTHGIFRGLQARLAFAFAQIFFIFALGRLTMAMQSARSAKL